MRKKGTVSKMLRSQKGFTLVEAMVASAILVIILLGLIQVFISSSAIAELAGNITKATSEAQTKMEEIRNSTYATIATDYASGGTPGNTFSISQPTGMGVIYIDSSNANLLTVEIDVSWRNSNKRIIGEDLDLDGVIDAGEDVSNPGRLSSMVKIISQIAKR